MSVVKLSVLVALRLLSPAAGMQTQRGQATDLIALDPATCVEAVVVEPRKIKSMATALLSAVNAKNAHFDLFTIAHGQLNGEYARRLVHNNDKLRSLKEQGNLRYLSLPFDDLGSDRIADMQVPNSYRLAMEEDLEHHDQYSRVLKSKGFWTEFACDRILLLQSDTTLCSNSNFQLSDFSNSEYIGGRNGKAGEKHNLPGKMLLNGGFSFRNRTSMLRCIDAVDSKPEDMRNWFKGMPEDMFFSNCVQVQQPPMGRCKKFAIASSAYAMAENFVPFGVHRPWRESGCHICKETNMRFCEGAIQLQHDLGVRE
jgi:hypothetical protein